MMMEIMQGALHKLKVPFAIKGHPIHVYKFKSAVSILCHGYEIMQWLTDKLFSGAEI